MNERAEVNICGQERMLIHISKKESESNFTSPMRVEYQIFSDQWHARVLILRSKQTQCSNQLTFILILEEIQNNYRLIMASNNSSIASINASNLSLDIGLNKSAIEQMLNSPSGTLECIENMILPMFSTSSRNDIGNDIDIDPDDFENETENVSPSASSRPQKRLKLGRKTEILKLQTG